MSPAGLTLICWAKIYRFERRSFGKAITLDAILTSIDISRYITNNNVAISVTLSVSLLRRRPLCIPETDKVNRASSRRLWNQFLVIALPTDWVWGRNLNRCSFGTFPVTLQDLKMTQKIPANKRARKPETPNCVYYCLWRETTGNMSTERVAEDELTPAIYQHKQQLHWSTKTSVV